MATLGRFLALSRASHGVLDLAMPCFAALLWLGHFPSPVVNIVALITAAAGYTALYALNDLVGVRVDRAKFAGAGPNLGYSVEGSALRHPLAQGELSITAGFWWFLGWYLIALLGSWWLNPVLLPLVLAAPVLEIIYCLLLKVTWWRVVVSGVVKALGPVAAVLVVVPRPDPWWLALMVAWLFSWEVGGQNIPADWNDVEEDRRVGARTIPLVFGPKVAGTVVVIALMLTVLLSLFLPLMSPLPLGAPYQAATLVIGVFLLLWPGFRLWRSGNGRNAARLFDTASFYPVLQLALIAVFVFL